MITTNRHHLKIKPAYFGAIVRGRKNFEIRKNDRNFNVGDILVLDEYTLKQGFTGRWIECQVTYVLYDFEEGLKAGFVVMSFIKTGNGRTN